MAGDNHVAADQLKNYVERVERLMEERKGINDDIKDVLAEAGSNGYDKKMIRVMIRERAKELHAREQERALFDTYAAALGIAV